MPAWIVIPATASLGLAMVCALWIAYDEMSHPQSMRIMYLVWPITALYGGPVGLWMYYAIGRGPRESEEGGDGGNRAPSNLRAGSSHRGEPKFAAVARGTTHCGAGCTLGDLCGETLLATVPALAAALGWHTLWEDKLFSAWVLDFALAFLLGILFQYFSIKPMHPEITAGRALQQALKADTLSLVSWQVGMYGVMALAHFWLFPVVLKTPPPPAGSVVFWWVMQFAMWAGFLTAFPVNRWLIARGIKESM